MIRINLRSVPCSGYGGRLFVIVDSSNDVTTLEIQGERVRWRENSYPYTAFIRNRNFQRTPRSCRGLLCVFRQHGEAGPYRLGVMGNLSPLWNNEVQIYEWTGKSATYDGTFTPQFIYGSKEFPVDFGTIASEFTLVTMETDWVQPLDLYFVNIVSTHPSFNLPGDCTNNVDSCFQMSPCGPQLVAFPETMPHVFNRSFPITSNWTVDTKNPLKCFNKHLPNMPLPSFLRENRQSVHHLPSDLYLFEHSGAPRLPQKKQQTLKGLLAVPYICTKFEREAPVEVSTYLFRGDICKFAFLRKRDWRKLVLKKQLTHEEHNSYLDQYCQGRVSLKVLSLRNSQKGGIRIAISKDIGKKLRRQLRKVQMMDSVMYHKEDHVSPNFVGPGLVVIRYLRQREVCCWYLFPLLVIYTVSQECATFILYRILGVPLLYP